MTTRMTEKQALATVIDIAARWAENAEEGFVRRIQESDDDDICRAIAEKSGALAEEVIEVRDLWRAIKVLSSTVKQSAT
jgi:hypothetical protein